MVNLPPAAAALYPWKGHTIDVDGGRMHYLDEGPRDAPVIVAVHGNPTWSFYWRALVAGLSDRYRVVVPDHVGCGFSDKPQDWPYRLEGHLGNLQRLVDHLELDGITWMVHDWGGAIGLGVAGRMPERTRRLIITNTAAFRSMDIPWAINLCRIPGFGALSVRGFNAFARAATFTTTERALPAAVKQGLVAPYSSWADRIATLRFVEDIPLQPSHPSYPTLSAVEDGLAGLADKPVRILWGDKDWCFTPAFREEFERRFPKAQVSAWDDVGHYVMEDAPERVLPAVEAFLEETA